jgi:hypothetical protein
MAMQNALHDENKWPALTAHTGTAGTAETIRVVADNQGALMVDIVSGESINVGTLTLGTINLVGSISTIGTMPAISMGNISDGTITTKEEDYDIRIDKVSDGTSYYGFAALGQGTNTAGTVWKIMQKVYSSTSSVFLFADGNKNFDNIWDNRGTLTYI